MIQTPLDRDGWATSTTGAPHYYRNGRPLCGNRYSKRLVLLAKAAALPPEACQICQRRQQHA